MCSSGQRPAPPAEDGAVVHHMGLSPGLIVTAQLAPAGEKTALRSQCLSPAGAQSHVAKDLAQSIQQAPQNHYFPLPSAQE